MEEGLKETSTQKECSECACLHVQTITFPYSMSPFHIDQLAERDTLLL